MLNIVQFQMIRRGISIKVMSQVPIKQKKLLCVLLLKDKYPNFEVGLKCILMVNPYLILRSYKN